MPVHEAWTIVSAVAARTSRVEIGQLVMCTAYRPPGLLAKMAATADSVSGGRITLGLGAGWHFEEYRAFGYPFDHRFERFEETLRIIAPLVRGETVTFDGSYHRAARPRRDRHLRRLVPPRERSGADAARAFDSHPDRGVRTAHAPAPPRLRRRFRRWNLRVHLEGKYVDPHPRLDIRRRNLSGTDLIGSLLNPASCQLPHRRSTRWLPMDPPRTTRGRKWLVC